MAGSQVTTDELVGGMNYLYEVLRLILADHTWIHAPYRHHVTDYRVVAPELVY